MDGMPKIGPIGGLEELGRAAAKPGPRVEASFAEALKDAVETVDSLQKGGEAAQEAYARGEQVDLHDVLIKVEEADVAFRAMMEVRNKLIEAYREIMRMAG